jgi:hypothetical protein
MNIELTRVMELSTVNGTERGNKSEAYWSMQFSRRRKGKKVNRMKTRGL